MTSSGGARCVCVSVWKGARARVSHRQLGIAQVKRVHAVGVQLWHHDNEVKVVILHRGKEWEVAKEEKVEKELAGDVKYTRTRRHTHTNTHTTRTRTRTHTQWHAQRTRVPMVLYALVPFFLVWHVVWSLYPDPGVHLLFNCSTHLLSKRG